MRARPVAQLLAAAAVLAVVFAGWLTLVETGWTPLRTVDLDVARDLNATFAPRVGLVDLWRVVSTVGQPVVFQVVAVLVALVVWRRGDPPLAVCTAAGALLASPLANVVKAVSDRPRPTVSVDLADAAGSSFPSGHATTSCAGVLVLLLVVLPHVPGIARTALGVLGAVVVAAVGFSRLALGVHYVSDVLGGWLLALAWVLLTRAAYRRQRPAA